MKTNRTAKPSLIRYTGPFRIIKKYDNNVTFKILKPKTGKTHKTYVSRLKRAKFTETWTPQPSTSNTSEDGNEPPRFRLSELKPFNFKQGYFENSSDEEKFNEFLTMTNMVTPQKITPITRRRKKSDSSSSEESEALDYTISPQTQFFQDKISTPYPPKRFPDSLVNPVTPIDRPFSLHDELNKAIQTPGDIRVRKGQPAPKTNITRSHGPY